MRKLIALIGTAAALWSMAGAQDVTVTVDAGQILAPVNPLLYGINTARWDESLFPATDDRMLLTCDRDAIAKVKASGVTMLKYPGGNDADSYVWNSPDNNPSEMGTDEYLAFCREIGAEPFITINFNQPPELAAAWVRYCNSGGRLHVTYWEVGDEQWGWWAKGHSTPEAYAAKYVTFVKAMKAVDPTIKVATNVFLGVHPERWTERVLAAAGEYIDMLTVTFYPQQWGKENDDSLLASTGVYREQMLRLRTDVERAIGAAKTAHILFVNVGYNSVNHSPGPQTLQMVNAVWVADMLGTMAEARTDIACYWALHNAFPPRKGDYGYLSSEGSNSPSYTYFVFPLFRRMFGDTLVASRSSDSHLKVYAARTGKMLSAVLVNTSAGEAKKAAFRVTRFRPAGTVHALLLDSTHLNKEVHGMRVNGSTVSVEVPPYAVLALQLIDRDSVIPAANLASEAHVTASSYSIIGPAFGPASAIDGLLSTRWNSAAWTKSDGKEQQWLMLSWDSSRAFTTVRIRWGETYARSYTLDVSDDGVAWRTVQDVPRGAGGVEEFTVAPLRARHLRMAGREGTGGRSTISAYSIREIEVYNRSR